MDIYDKANELAALLKQSEEYRTFKALKDSAYENEADRALIKQYKALQFEAQSTYIAGKEPGAELMEQLKKLGEILQFNPKISEYMLSEYRFNTMIADIYKIIGDACDVGIDFLNDK